MVLGKKLHQCWTRNGKSAIFTVCTIEPPPVFSSYKFGPYISLKINASSVQIVKSFYMGLSKCKLKDYRGTKFVI